MLCLVRIQFPPRPNSSKDMQVSLFGDRRGDWACTVSSFWQPCNRLATYQGCTVPLSQAGIDSWEFTCVITENLGAASFR